MSSMLQLEISKKTKKPQKKAIDEGLPPMDPEYDENKYPQIIGSPTTVKAC